MKSQLSKVIRSNYLFKISRASFLCINFKKFFVQCKKQKYDERVFLLLTRVASIFKFCLNKRSYWELKNKIEKQNN